MTRHEKRVLYLLRKHGGGLGTIGHALLVTRMSRVKAVQREQAFAALEDLELISSAKTPSVAGRGGRPGRVYWLTEAGRHHVEDLIARGELKDPSSP